MLTRRTLIKQLGLIASGALILPACDLSPRKVSIALDNLKITVEQEDLMKLLVDAIIPTGEMRGAKELGVDRFVWVMADDCLKKEQQDKFLAGLGKFSAYLQKVTEKKFFEIEVKEQITFLEETMAQEAPEPPQLPLLKQQKEDEKEPPIELYLAYIQHFIGTVKSFTIQGYLQSEYIMREVMPYALVPGDIKRCQTIDPTKRINING